MTSALLTRIHPSGPWRYGPGEGGEDRVDDLYRSDRLYSAVALAFERLGWMDEWLDATARAPVCAVRFSSLFPFQGESLFVPPPATMWPPPPAALRITSPVFSTKVRWRAAQFVPLSLIETLLSGQRLIADQWIADPESRCMLRRDRPQSGPFRTVTRTRLAIDRLGSASAAHKTAAVEFKPGGGLWTVAVFSNEDSANFWSSRIRSALHLLADSGFGGRRSNGWGQVARIEFQESAWPDILLPRLARQMAQRNVHVGNQEDGPLDYWLLSLFSPYHEDAVDWSGGSYSLTTRGGRVESKAGFGKEKKAVRMIEEGSVLASRTPPKGCAVDVAPDGFEHLVYRAGFALAIQIPRVDFSSLPPESGEVGELSEALDEALRAAVDEAEAISRDVVETAAEEQPLPGPERVPESLQEALTGAPREDVQPAAAGTSGTTSKQEVSPEPLAPAAETQEPVGTDKTDNDQRIPKDEPRGPDAARASESATESGPEKHESAGDRESEGKYESAEEPPSPSEVPPKLKPEQAELPERINQQKSGSDEMKAQEAETPDRSEDEPRNEV
jgi:CRISPR type III-A-associated RAMP protein Csm4